jgi:hypothetical protein
MFYCFLIFFVTVAIRKRLQKKLILMRRHVLPFYLIILPDNFKPNLILTLNNINYKAKNDVSEPAAI